MVCAPTCTRKRTLDYSDKYRNLNKFTTDVEHFLEEYNRIVEHSLAYHRSFRRDLKHLYDDIGVLLQKFQHIRRSGLKEQLFMEKFCCGVFFDDCEELRRHYFEFHNFARLIHPSIVELRSGHGKLQFFHRRLQEYICYGTESTSVMIVNLKKIANNMRLTLERGPKCGQSIVCFARYVPDRASLVDAHSGQDNQFLSVFRKVRALRLTSLYLILMGVPTTVYIHTNIYNYSNKYKNLDRFQNDVKRFLKEYDSIVLHKDLYKLVFKSYLREIRFKVKKLLAKFEAAPSDDGSTRPEKEMFCCGLPFADNEQFRKHYQTVHNEAFLVYTNRLELKSAFAKLDHMRHRLDEYTRFGKEYTCALLIDLKRVSKKISCTLKF